MEFWRTVRHFARFSGAAVEGFNKVLGVAFWAHFASMN